jgi:hypothetical protein
MTPLLNNDGIQYRLKGITQTYETIIKDILHTKEEVSHNHGYCNNPQPSFRDSGSNEHSSGSL